MRKARYAAALGIPLLALLSFTLVTAWTGPTAAPPGSNIAAPVNVGTTDQVKNGGLGVNSLAVFGNAILSGVGRYFNFGSTAGSSGYGIRDNAGLLEFKNSGGSWESIQATVFNLVGGVSPWTTSGNNIYNANTGNVGIGTASPGAKLEVKDGYIRAAAGTNSPPPAGTGKGVNIVAVSATGNGYVQAYDRTANAYIPFNINLSMLIINFGLQFPNGSVQTTASRAFGGLFSTQVLPSAGCGGTGEQGLLVIRIRADILVPPDIRATRRCQ